MTPIQTEELIAVAKERISGADPSHDFAHALRIMKLATRLAREEGGDLEVIVPAALFHDLVVHPKDSPQSSQSSTDSAAAAAEILRGLDWYPAEKIAHVACVIERCSFSKNLPKESLEENIVQDADMLESLGAVAVARTFCSSGQMGRALHDIDDPAATNRELDARRFGLDLFGARLFKVKERLATASARRLAEGREKFLREYFDQFLREIEGEA